MFEIELRWLYIFENDVNSSKLTGGHILPSAGVKVVEKIALKKL